MDLQVDGGSRGTRTRSSRRRAARVGRSRRTSTATIRKAAATCSSARSAKRCDRSDRRRLDVDHAQRVRAAELRAVVDVERVCHRSLLRRLAQTRHAADVGNRDQRDVDFGLNGQGVGGGTLAIRGWDGRQIENQRATAIRSATLRNAEDSSSNAQIPSHDWGASALWTRTGLAGLESFSVGADFRHYQGDYNETDYNTTGCPAGTCGTIARQISSGGNQSLSGAFLQAIAAPFSPLRIELSARVDQWNNNDGHSFLTGGTQTTYQRPVEDGVLAAARRALPARLVVLVARGGLQGVPRAEPRRAVSQAGSARRRSPCRIRTSAPRRRSGAKSASTGSRSTGFR